MSKFQQESLVRVIRKNDVNMQMFGKCGKIFEIVESNRTSRPIAVLFEDGGCSWFKESELQFQSEVCIDENKAVASRISLDEMPDLMGPRAVGQEGPPSHCLLL